MKKRNGWKRVKNRLGHVMDGNSGGKGEDSRFRGAAAQPSFQAKIWKSIFSTSTLRKTKRTPTTPSNNTTNRMVEEAETKRTQISKILRDNSFACIFYFVCTALHAVVWSNYFPTRAEQRFWCGASLVVGISPSTALCLVLLFKSIQQLPRGKRALKGAKTSLQ